ncbi:MAG: PDZ domain-containing protein [Mariniblastus sp.]
MKIPKVKPPKVKIPVPKITPPKIENPFKNPKLPSIPKPKIPMPQIPQIPGPFPIPTIPRPQIPIPKLPDPFKDLTPSLPSLPGPTIPLPEIPTIPGLKPTLPVLPGPILPGPLPKIPDPFKSIGKDLEARLKQKTRAFEGDVNRTLAALARATQAAGEEFKRLGQAIKYKDGDTAVSLVRSIMKKSPEFQNLMENAVLKNLQSITFFNSVGGSAIGGIEGGVGLALSTTDLLYGDKIEGSFFIAGALSLGLQAGGGADIALGLSAPRPHQIAGMGIGVGADFKVAAGGSASLTFDTQERFSGFAVGLGAGAEMGAKGLVDYTHILKKFSIPDSITIKSNRAQRSQGQSLQQYPNQVPGSQQPNWNQSQNPTPSYPNQFQSQPSGGGTLNPTIVQSGQKILGVHSLTTQMTGRNYQWGQQITQVVAGSAAQRAGLEAGDTIVAINGTQVQSEQSLRQAIQASGSLMSVKVINVRNGQLVDVQVSF